MTGRLALVLLSSLLMTHLAPLLGAQGRVGVRALLEHYNRGDHAAAVAQVARLTDLGDFLDELQQTAPTWIGAANDDAALRRRFVAASFALEAAYAGPRGWAAARHLVEWGCEVQRAGLLMHGATPSSLQMQAYRVWQLASMALIQSAHDYVFLMGLPAVITHDEDLDRRNARNHVMHALADLPDEPRLFLAFAVAAEHASWGFDSPNPTWLDAKDVREPVPSNARFDAETARWFIFQSRVRLPGARFASRGDIPVAAAKSDTLWELVDILQGRPPMPAPLRGHAAAPSIQPDLSVRLGNTYLRLGRPDLAEPVLRRALTETSEPYLVYLAHVLLARGFEAQGRITDAETHYRLALQQVPHAQSAAVPLAAILFTSGRRAAATDIIGPSVAQNAPDPWRLYQSGDARHLPVLIDLLRRAQK
jgi:tetratricopeptide (TPR) repeat protein